MYVGDLVNIEKDTYSKDKYIITSVKPRINLLPRPKIANIQKLLIVMSSVPIPDMELVDKLIIYCMMNGIEPIIVVSKSDVLDEAFISDIMAQYYFLTVFAVSSKKGIGIADICKYISGSITAVCGQSAAGKSTLINAIIPGIDLQTQDVSKKISRGKQTTRSNSLYYYKDIIIADTPGFSRLDLNIDCADLSAYYPEFDEYLGKCKYLDCAHIKEGADCAIVTAVESGKINKNRYDRYVSLYQKLKILGEKKYD